MQRCTSVVGSPYVGVITDTERFFNDPPLARRGRLRCSALPNRTYPAKAACVNSTPMFEAAVVISTRNRAAELDVTLRSLLADRSRVKRELIIVDNGSTDSTREVVGRVAAEHQPSPIRLIPQEAPGKSRSLNVGVAAADAEFLIFTDDDVTVDDGWADALVAPFADPSVAVVGGRTLPVWPTGHAPGWLGSRIAEDLGLRDAGDTPRRLDPHGVVGVNMALRRSALMDIEGPFETSLRPTAA